MASKSPKIRAVPSEAMLPLLSDAEFSTLALQGRGLIRTTLAERNRGPELTQDELDCLLIAVETGFTNAQTSPNYDDVERTSAYARGCEIKKRYCAPVIPAHLNPEFGRATMGSLRFKMVFHREPKAGDVLCFEDMQTLARRAIRDAERYVLAWRRQIPDLPCPVRVDDGRILMRMNGKTNWCPPYPRVSVPSDPDSCWVAPTNFTAQEMWRDIERELFELAGNKPGSFRREDVPHCRAVVFLGIVDGKRLYRPLDEADTKSSTASAS